MRLEREKERTGVLTRLLAGIVLLTSVWCQSAEHYDRHGGRKLIRRTCMRGHACTTSESNDHSPAPRDLPNGRLPQTLLPYYYVIEMWPDIYLGKPPFPFTGHVLVYFHCVQSTETVYMNSAYLEVDENSVEIALAEDSPVDAAHPQWVSLETEDNFKYLALHLAGPLAKGAKYWVKMAFSGTLREQPENGFYWDFYEVQGQTRYLALTQFQPHYARFAFPCFDEPAMKATYDVIIVRKQHMVALSNMPVSHYEDRGDGWIADHFETTPVMSVYLVCLAINDFVYVESVTSSGIQVRVWAREEVLHTAGFALEIAGPFLEWFEEYTQIPYPLPKIDHVAVPHKAGAMENWGLAIYVEHYLLWDHDWSPSTSLYTTAVIIGHEISHQWFGNLVTCWWWDDAWLNEGLASYFEYAAFQDVLGWPGSACCYGYEQSEMHLMSGVALSMGADCFNAITAVRQQNVTPADASTAFSGGAYYKGGAIVRMLQQILGPDTLRRALQRYLMAYAYQSVTTDEFWAVLTEQAAEDGVTSLDGSPLDIKARMDPWVNQKGYPLLTIHRQTGGEARIYQSQFINPSSQEMEPSPWQYRWHVPVSFYTEEGPTWDTRTRFWLDSDNDSLTEGIPRDPANWLVANTRHLDYIRVNYDDVTKAAIVRQLLADHQVIQVENRAQFINDAFALSSAGYQGEAVAMETTRYLVNELSYIPWRAADNALEYTALLLSRFQETVPIFQVYMRHLVDPVYEVLGWDHLEDDSYEITSLRGRIIWLACSYGNADCVKKAKEHFENWRQGNNNNPTLKEHRLTVYCTAIRAGDIQHWEYVRSAYLAMWTSSHPHVSRERNTLLVAMSCTQDAALLRRYYELTFDPKEIRCQDTEIALTAIAESDHTGRQLVWDGLKMRWRNNPIPPWISQDTILSAVVDSFASDEDLRELEDFIYQYPAQSSTEQVVYQQVRNKVESNHAWASSNQRELHHWLQEHTPMTTAHGTGHVVRSGTHHLLRLLDATEQANFVY